MKHNMGKRETQLRLWGGLALIVYSLWNGLNGALALQVVLAAVGFILMITGIFAFCPINAVIRHNSCHACKSGDDHAHMPG